MLVTKLTEVVACQFKGGVLHHPVAVFSNYHGFQFTWRSVFVNDG